MIPRLSRAVLGALLCVAAATTLSAQSIGLHAQSGDEPAFGRCDGYTCQPVAGTIGRGERLRLEANGEPGMVHVLFASTGVGPCPVAMPASGRFVLSPVGLAALHIGVLHGSSDSPCGTAGVDALALTVPANLPLGLSVAFQSVGIRLLGGETPTVSTALVATVAR